ncbi:hypothetical protein [Nocardia terpenica]|uniref:hypothetical protein n=1 Tax=Nocardia terpenica TaxID=455432 RepID=UPI001E5C130F|nr:hypothetical protein [Nocardia terpenica]
MGYLRTDISGQHQQWDETRMRNRAARLGYKLAKTVAFSNRQDQPIEKLVETVRKVGAEAVFVPGPQHFEGQRIPVEIVQIADVVTVDPEGTYARRATGDVPDLNETQR